MPEGLQRRSTKMISSLRNLSYKERLKRLGMFSLRCRRLRGNITEVFKMIQGIDKRIDEDRRTRKHGCLKMRRHVNSNIRFKFFIRSY